MRYSAAEKLEIIRLIEQSHLPVRRTLEPIGVPRATFHRWYDRYATGGPETAEGTGGPRFSKVSSTVLSQGMDNNRPSHCCCWSG
jgi:putative transposase